MKKQKGFNLIEVILTISALTILIAAYLQLNNLRLQQQQTTSNTTNLLAFSNTLEWFLLNTPNPIGHWYGYVDANTGERQFTKIRPQTYICEAEIKTTQKMLLKITLYTNSTHKTIDDTIKIYMPQNTQN